jgi:hypothetical protein
VYSRYWSRIIDLGFGLEFCFSLWAIMSLIKIAIIEHSLLANVLVA